MDTKLLSKKFGQMGARVKVEPFEKGIIIPHEKTLKGPRADRYTMGAGLQRV